MRCGSWLELVVGCSFSGEFAEDATKAGGGLLQRAFLRFHGFPAVHALALRGREKALGYFPSTDQGASAVAVLFPRLGSVHKPLFEAVGAVDVGKTEAITFTDGGETRLEDLEGVSINSTLPGRAARLASFKCLECIKAPFGNHVFVYSLVARAGDVVTVADVDGIAVQLVGHV